MSSQPAAGGEVPAWLECWKSEDERKSGPDHERERWLNRPTFIIASIGSAIGLGNFWRFPYLTYKYDGAFFFFPYLMSLFFMGIPLLLQELSLGQKIQRGDISVFRGIHPRLAGIGAASVYSVYIITFYYTVIISWSVVYFIAGFASPLPWSDQNDDFVAKCDMTKMTRAEQFLMVDVIRFWDDNCKAYEPGDDSLFSWKSFFAVSFVWICIFLCVFKGVKSSSYIVWITVPVPALFVVIMVINGLQLEGAGDGIKQYLRGNENKFDGLTGDVLAAAKQAEEKVQEGVWSDAAGQIFFSIGVCIGVMTSYGSYNPVRKPIILDNFVIALSNSCLSFIAGFAVWSVVGYLQSIDSIAKSKTSSIGLAFIAYPTAIDSMNMPNLWAIILGLTLFMLGIDSAFSFIEAASTVICDTQWGRNYPRMFVAFVLCMFGYILSIPFCTNWGFILFDVVDYYMSNTLLILVGILQCFGCGWGFDAENTYRKSDNHAKSMLALGFGFWGCLAILALIFVLIEKIAIGLIITAAVIFLLVSPISFFLSKLSFKDWYNEVFMCGVRKLGYSMSMLNREDDGKMKAWEPYFVFYFGFTIKFSTPIALMYIFINAIKRNVEDPYGGYSTTFHVIGIIIPVIGFLFFLYFVFFNVHEEPFDHSQFEEGLQEIELSKVNQVANGQNGQPVDGDKLGLGSTEKGNNADEAALDQNAPQPEAAAEAPEAQEEA